VSFRRRVVLLAAGAVAAAVVIASVVVYVVTRNELVGQIDASLRRKPPSVAFTGINANELATLRREGKVPPNVKIVSTRKHLPDGATEEEVGVQLRNGSVVHGSVQVTAPAAGGGHGPTHPASTRGAGIAPPTLGAAERGQRYLVERGSFPAGGPGPSELMRIGSKARLAIPVPTLGGATGYVQLSSPNGPIVHSGKLGPLLPVTVKAQAVAAGTHPAFYSNATVDGTPVRVFTEQAGNDAVWQAALPLTDLNSTLSHLRLVLALVCLGGIALAGALGLIVSRAALVPVRRLTGAAEEVTRTQDLGHRIEDSEGDELGRLAGSFNTMLAALEDARLAQRQLVSDASHELRTPLTSVRANLDALADERLAPSERARVVAAVQAQLAELTVLVSDLVDLSKGEVAPVEVEDVRFDLAASSAVERAGLHAPACRFSLEVEPCLVRASPARLDRAIANLLDNACRWNPPGGPPIEVRLRNGALQVRDHGPGIATEDLPHVFDRFYRAAVARALPGSGLGLAIVRQVADMHGGSVRAENDPGGGACLTLTLPALAMSESELRGCAAAADLTRLHDPPRSFSGDSQVADA
jgi:two-component system, OmpR family, sensor histidine kinase MprB